MLLVTRTRFSAFLALVGPGVSGYPWRMSHLTLEIPADALLALRGSEEAVGSRLLLAAAMKLFEMGELSSGAAASLAGVPRVVFLAKLADFGVDTFRLTEAELNREARLA